MSFRLGCIDYINIWPVTWRLQSLLAESHAGDVEVVFAEPGSLNARLAAGELALSPVSSMEYAQHPESYLLLSGCSIASDGPVQSVLLFSTRPVERLHGATLGVCSATATSVVLLDTLLRDEVGVEPQYRRNSTWDDLLCGRVDALLQIGDEALRHGLDPEVGQRFEVVDLGAWWKQATGLPMVYAVWALRRDCLEHPLMHPVSKTLGACVSRAGELSDELLEAAAARLDMSSATVRAYYEALYYTLGEREQAGLLEFYRRAARRGACLPLAGLEFYAPSRENLTLPENTPSQEFNEGGAEASSAAPEAHDLRVELQTSNSSTSAQSGPPMVAASLNLTLQGACHGR